jgi:hypothetical protein
MQTPERQAESRDGLGTGLFESFQQASVAQQLQDLPAETASLRNVSDLRLLLEDQRLHSGQAQFNSEHQACRAGAHDDHVSVRHWPLPSKTFGATGDAAETPVSSIPVE